VIAVPDPPLTDGVVTLRQWVSADVLTLVESIDGDEEMTRWMDAIPQPYLDAEAQSWIEQASSYWHSGTSAPFAVTDAETGAVLGGVGFGWVGDEGVGEVGYWLRSDARGRGLTTRAVRLISNWSFAELKCQRLQLRADANNFASQRVAEKAGFMREGVLRAVHFNPREQRRVDFVMFSLLPGELDLPA
jgi:RimJ/RimL family protein N-acetyltransferase